MSTQTANQTEQDRVLELSELDLDYAALSEDFKDLTRLAAKIAGTEISLVNLIDTYTQWTVSDYGINLAPMSREDSVCTYTIRQQDSFEVKDLSADERFMDKDYVKGEAGLRYYFGIPLQTPAGHNIGALCVLDKRGKDITPEKKELLRIIANEIVTRLLTLKTLQQLRSNVRESNDAKKKVAHDIRGPLGGIIGLANIISQQGNANKLEDVLEFITLIQKSSKSLLELAEDILGADKKNTAASAPADSSKDYTLIVFQRKLEQLYEPLAVNKQLHFSVTAVPGYETISFSRNKLLQIAGNLISNAMKFTPAGGSVQVKLELQPGKLDNTLVISVADSGTGIAADTIKAISEGSAASTDGTEGEKGYGFGLSLVKKLVAGLNGTIDIRSEAGKGTEFLISLPMKRL